MDRILHVQHRLDSGKFPIYEIAQHGWMSLFGDSEAAMRALPALIGSLSIVLVFILGVELMLAVSEDASLNARPARSQVDPQNPTDLSRKNGRHTTHQSVYIVAGLCALLFAVGLPSVEIARQARMYSMMQGWVLAQVIFLLRARRLGGLANYAGLTIFWRLRSRPILPRDWLSPPKRRGSCICILPMSAATPQREARRRG